MRLLVGRSQRIGQGIGCGAVHEQPGERNNALDHGMLGRRLGPVRVIHRDAGLLGSKRHRSACGFIGQLYCAFQCCGVKRLSSLLRTLPTHGMTVKCGEREEFAGRPEQLEQFDQQQHAQAAHHNATPCVYGTFKYLELAVMTLRQPLTQILEEAQQGLPIKAQLARLTRLWMWAMRLCSVGGMPRILMRIRRRRH